MDSTHDKKNFPIAHTKVAVAVAGTLAFAAPGMAYAQDIPDAETSIVEIVDNTAVSDTQDAVVNDALVADAEESKTQVAAEEEGEAASDAAAESEDIDAADDAAVEDENAAAETEGQDVSANEGEGVAAQNAEASATEGATEEPTEATDAVEENLAVTEESTAAGEALGTDEQKVSYDYNATLDLEHPGVYETQISPNSATAAEAPTIGAPSIADKNLPDAPTTESPAIIQGAAVGYEEKVGPLEYVTIAERPAPYSEFKLEIIEEKGTDGTIHRKPTGFDGTYVIYRLDVSEFFSGKTAEELSNSYLHIKQEGNAALRVQLGMVDNNKAFGDGLGNKAGAYLMSDLVDPNGTTPFIDVILLSTGGLAAGADAGKADALTGDVPLHVYIDNVFDYNPSLVYDATSTDPNHLTNCLAKFYDATKVAADAISNYKVMGSDLALEVSVADSAGENKDTGTTYWSLKKAIENPYYDLAIDADPNDPGCGRTVKLITEVPIVGELTLAGTDENNLKKRTLDVNSFDVQVANNTTQDSSTYTAGVTLENGWLTIADKSNTTGAEMAIGNNARFTINNAGKLIIDETCQLEIEWDGATTTPGTTPATPDILNDGILDLNAGGEIINNGIITIEGTEGKPATPATGQAAQQATEAAKGQGELIIEPGATFTNNGALMIYGLFYNLGTVVNNGHYSDVIASQDPDKGLFEYHKGIVIAWKDDITQSGVKPGEFYNGRDSQGNIYTDALLVNNGDILVNPGAIYNYATLQNAPGSNIYLGVVTEAIIPIEPDPNNPTVVTKRITLDEPVSGVMYNYGVLCNEGNIVPATVVILDNTGLGALTTPGDNPEYFGFPKTNNFGTVVNLGYIYGWDSEYGAVDMGIPQTGDSTSPMQAATLALAALPFLAMGYRRIREEEE